MPSSGSSSTSSVQVVTDLEGRRYTLVNIIGEGGQGQVYGVKEGRLAVKLLRSSSAPKRERLQRCIQAVRRLNLEGLPIVAPIAILRPPHVGYVMPLASRMSSLRSMMNPPGDGRSVSEWYIATGGLRARLRRLCSMFGVFAKLHGRGLVYGDPSPDNILFSSASDDSAAFLIDADNLHVEGNPVAAHMFTPGYGAPELIMGATRPDTLTDSFALAVIAFELLTLVHPFVGDVVHDGEPELEEAAFHGRMPWIEHSTDTRNRCSRGIPRDLAISPEAKRLFKRMFEDGLKQRLLRPGVGEWTDVLAQAVDVTILCPRCTASHYAPAARECPWCGAGRPKLVRADFHLWDPEGNSSAHPASGGFVTTPNGRYRSMATLVLAAREPLKILRRHVDCGIPAGQAEQPLLQLSLTRENAVLVHNLTKKAIPLVNHAGKSSVTESLEAGGDRLIPVATKAPHWHLHFGPLSELHRAVVFTPMP